MKSTTVKKKAIDITPHEHYLPCYINNIYHEVGIALRSWSEDGKQIVFMLDTHNFVFADPDEELEVIEDRPKYATKEFMQRVLKKDAEQMADRPLQKELELQQARRLVVQLLEAMRMWGSWEDGVPSSEGTGEVAKVGRAYDEAEAAVKSWKVEPGKGKT